MDRDPADVEIQQIADHLHTFKVPNLHGPSGQATNVFVVGPEPVTLIDTGSDDGGATVFAALDRLGISRVATILLTHTHHDHAGSAHAVRAATGATVLLHERDLNGPGPAVAADGYLSGGDVFEAGSYRLQTIDTPGHAPGHVSFFEPQLRILFAGDLMSGNGSIAIVPPRGSMGDYLNSLRRVQSYDVQTVYPGHGPVIENGAERIQEYIEHRERREAEILELINAGVGDIETLTAQLYPDVLPRLRPLAAGTVLAHIVNLLDRSEVRVAQPADELAASRFAAAEATAD